jgi:hypothetical protein
MLKNCALYFSTNSQTLKPPPKPVIEIKISLIRARSICNLRRKTLFFDKRRIFLHSILFGKIFREILKTKNCTSKNQKKKLKKKNDRFQWITKTVTDQSIKSNKIK